MEKIKEFFVENHTVIVIGICLLILICWLHHDAERNKPNYDNTDKSVAELNERIKSLESRLDGMSKRIDETQKTVNGIAVGITRSTGYAIEVNEGIGRAEERLESAVQRSERIENLIREIEEGYRQGKTSPQKTNLAK